MLIIPSILTSDLNELTSLESKAEGVVDRIQIDVIDNKFVNNVTIDPAVLKNISTFLNLDFHLMVENPIEWIAHCVIKEKTRIIGQIEKMPNQFDFVQKVKTAGILPGLAVNLETPIKNLDENVLKDVDVVLLMSVEAGWGGQQFSLDVWDKIKEIATIRQKLNLKFKICVDGGITSGLVRDMEKLGVDEVAVGKRIFEPDLKENLKNF